MSNCYLCLTEAEPFGQDFGRRKIVRCPDCGYYEVTNTAITKLEDQSIPSGVKESLIKTIKQINKNKNDAEVFFDGNVLCARKKNNT